MTVKQRMLTIRLMEKVERDPGYAKRLGIRAVYGERKEKEGRMAELPGKSGSVIQNI